MSNRDEILRNAGWERRSITDQKRINELVELYESLGFEVLIEPLTQDLLTLLGENCQICFNGDGSHHKVIYTRKRT
jgi:hypothetical protein